MKPETKDQPFDMEGWVFELKYDGFRLLAARIDATARLAWRSGHEVTGVFPELARAVIGLPFRSVLLDGEAVILDESGRPSFQRLQRRSKRARPIEAERAAAESPAVMFVFDLLEIEGFDLRPLPLVERKAILRKVLPAEGPLRYVEAIPQRGVDLYGAVSSMGLEGIVAKRADSPYRNGYSKDWLKIRVDRTGDFAVAGFEPAAPASGGLSRLHLALREGGELVYAGTVGSGFSNDEIREIRARLEPARRPAPAVKGAPKSRQIAWVEPELVCEVRYKEWTEGGHLRLPVFLRLRDDKTVLECRRPEEDAPEEEAAEPPPEAEALESTTGKPRFTRLDKVFWPEEGYTKGDLIEYYRAIWPWIPALPARPAARARPLSGRHLRQVLLPEERARDRREPGADRAHPQRERRDRVLPLRRPGFAPLPRQPGGHPPPYLGEPGDRARAAGLVHPGSRSQGSALPGRGADRAGDRRPVRGDRAALLREDERRQWAPSADAARRAVRPRRLAPARGAAGAGDRRPAAGDRDHRPGDSGAQGEGLRRRAPEWPRQAARRTVQRPAASGRHGLDPPLLERGRPAARPRRSHPEVRPPPARPAQGRSPPAGAGAPARPAGSAGPAGRAASEKRSGAPKGAAKPPTKPVSVTACRP